MLKRMSCDRERKLFLQFMKVPNYDGTALWGKKGFMCFRNAL